MLSIISCHLSFNLSFVTCSSLGRGIPLARRPDRQWAKRRHPAPRPERRHSSADAVDQRLRRNRSLQTNRLQGPKRIQKDFQVSTLSYSRPTIPLTARPSVRPSVSSPFRCRSVHLSLYLFWRLSVLTVVLHLSSYLILSVLLERPKLARIWRFSLAARHYLSGISGAVGLSRCS